VISLMLIGGRKMFAQGSQAQSMITRAVDDSQRVTLRGNVHPMARAEYDKGAAPSTMPMSHMLLILKRSPDQEAALQALNAQQQDKTSPNYHKWLTPAQFGEEFGPSDQDVTAITTWLGSHGFQVAPVANGRNMIDFSGTAGEVREAFNTEIHHYVVNAKDHYANASEPQIPAALAPMIAGISSLNDFRPKPMHHAIGAFQMSLPSRKVTPVSKPQFTLAGGDCYGTSPATNCYAMAPYDFATIYNLLPLWGSNFTGITGAGERIAIVSDSNINSGDVMQFRSLMGLPAQTVTVVQGSNAPAGLTAQGVNVVLATNADPQLENCSVNTDEQEAILDVEWAGAAAPGATIDLVAAPSAPAGTCNGASNSGETGLPAGYTSSFGGDYAAYYAIHVLNDPILSDSFGECELQLGSSGNAFYNALWQMASTDGITVLVATGDNGSAGCDNPNGTQPAQDGLQVDGTASTPYNVAVGGTDFAYITAGAAATYWSSTNQATGANTLSANGPIPETVYNDSCTNSELFSSFSVSSAVNSCNSATAQGNGFDTPVGSSGGFSNCTTPSGLAVADCAGGYAKPTTATVGWTQSAPGVPSDGKRDIPDLSLFSGDGNLSGTFYIVCEEDAFVLSSPPVADTPCLLTPAATAFFAGEGGTSVSTQAFAGIVALIDQKSGKREGNINTNLYALAGSETFANCNNSGSTALANSSTCIFKDVTTGTNSQACVSGSTNCGTTISSYVVPINGPEFRFRWTPLGVGLLVALLCVTSLAFFLPEKQRRWAPGLALLLLSVMIGVVSCGGGGSTGTVTGGGGGGTGTTTVGVLSGYNAAVGYDRATGLGSVNAANLVNASGW
jgi:subtilase family serine protease